MMKKLTEKQKDRLYKSIKTPREAAMDKECEKMRKFLKKIHGN